MGLLAAYSCLVISCLTIMINHSETKEIRYDITSGPDNVAVLAGSPATFPCFSDSTLLLLDWIFTEYPGTGPQPPLTIVSGCQLNPIYEGIYRVDVGPTSCNVTLISATAQTAGLYYCKETVGFPPPESATLTVYEADPSCDVVTQTPDIVEGDVVTLTCTFSYASSILSQAVMEWTDSSGQPVNSSERVESNFLESSITFIAGSPTVDTYTCLTYFDVPDDLPSTAKNIPDYNFTYTSPDLKVVHCPSDINITVPTGDLFVGQQLVCASNGYPDVSYSWEHAGTGVITQGATLTLDRAGSNYYTCTATVIVNGEPCSVFTESHVVVTASSCFGLKQINPRAASDRYTLTLKSGVSIEVYCEMGLNDGGYTFLSPPSLLDITEDDLAMMHTDQSNILIRTKNCDGTQRFGVIEQLAANSNIPLTVSLSSNDGYENTTNSDSSLLDSPYLYFGFLPSDITSTLTTWGLRVNGSPIPVTKTPSDTSNYLALFPGFEATQWIDVGALDYSFCNQFFSYNLPMPSGRVMPEEYFMFLEMVWENACYTNTNSVNMKNDLWAYCVTSVAIGFR